MTSQQESERRFNGRRWTAQQVAGGLFALVVAGGGGGWLWTHQADDGRELGNHATEIANLKDRVARLEQYGSPAVGVVASQIGALDVRVTRLETGAVSRDAINDLQHQIEAADKRSQDRDTSILESIGDLKRGVLGEGSKRIGPYK